MYFTVKFSSTKGYAVDIHSKCASLASVDFIRSSLNLNLTAHKIQSRIKGLSFDSTITISEKVARKSGCFVESSSIIVKTEEKELNKIESDIMRGFRNEWRKRINIRQGKKEEKLVVSFKERAELKDLIHRLSRIL